ncbi:MAG: hypothetical protein GY810_04705 [Aureispira sp.]|nr:hypothetical protein [Aureispira sp.]
MFNLPEWLRPKIRNSKSYTLNVVEDLTKMAEPKHPQSIEGIGSVGCLGGLLLLLSLLIPSKSTILKILFIPLALIILLLGIIVEPLWRIVFLPKR